MCDNFSRRLVDGDKSAFEELFEQYYFPMRTYTYRFVQSIAVAEDITQDVFSQLWVSRSQTGNIRSIKAWLFTSAHNSAVNYLKHKYVEEKYSQQTLSASEAIEQMHQLTIPDSDRLHSQEMTQIIRNMIKALPEQTRRIFLLSRQYNLKNKDIAEFLDINIKTVEKHITKALLHLKTELRNT